MTVPAERLEELIRCANKLHPQGVWLLRSHAIDLVAALQELQEIKKKARALCAMLPDTDGRAIEFYPARRELVELRELLK